MNKKNRLIHRSLSTLITLAVVLAVVLLNAGLALFLGDNVLTIDMTTEGFNEISDESKALLKDIDPEENHITIYFLADKDELQSPEMGYSTSYTGSSADLWGMRYVWEIAQSFAKEYSYIDVQTLNIRRDTKKLDEFRTTAGTVFTKQDVIIDNYTAEKDSSGNFITDDAGEPIMHHNFRLCKRDSFYVTDSNTSYAYAFNGDLRFTSTILSLAGANPTVYFLTGHGEPVGDGSTLDDSMAADYGQASALRDLLFKAGFVTKKINLQTEYKQLFEDDSARLIILFGPKTDLVSRDLENGRAGEVDILRKFLGNEDHHLMVFFDGSPENLPNLQEYCWDYWGVRATDQTVRDSGTNSLTPDGLVFNADYESDADGVGTNLTKYLTALTSAPPAIFRNSNVLELSEAHLQNNGFYEAMTTTYVGPVFLAPTSAYAVNPAGETVADYRTGGKAPLMALSFSSRYTRDNREVSNFALFSGSLNFADDSYLESASYCNADVLFYSMRLMARETVPFTIDYKVVQGQALESVSPGDVIGWTIFLCGPIPLAALICGTVVFIKRRHR